MSSHLVMTPIDNRRDLLVKAFGHLPALRSQLAILKSFRPDPERELALTWQILLLEAMQQYYRDVDPFLIWVHIGKMNAIIKDNRVARLMGHMAKTNKHRYKKVGDLPDNDRYTLIHNGSDDWPMVVDFIGSEIEASQYGCAFVYIDDAEVKHVYMCSTYIPYLDQAITRYGKDWRNA